MGSQGNREKKNKNQGKRFTNVSSLKSPVVSWATDGGLCHNSRSHLMFYPFHFTVLCLSSSLMPGGSSLASFTWAVLQHFTTPSWFKTMSSHSDDVHWLLLEDWWGIWGRAVQQGHLCTIPSAIHTEKTWRKTHLIIILALLHLVNEHQFLMKICLFLKINSYIKYGSPATFQTLALAPHLPSVACLWLTGTSLPQGHSNRTFSDRKWGVWSRREVSKCSKYIFSAVYVEPVRQNSVKLWMKQRSTLGEGAPECGLCEQAVGYRSGKGVAGIWHYRSGRLDTAAALGLVGVLWGRDQTTFMITPLLHSVLGQDFSSLCETYFQISWIGR